MTKPIDARTMKKRLRSAGWRFVRQTGGGGHELWESHDGGVRHVTSFNRKTLDNRATAELLDKIEESRPAWEAYQSAVNAGGDPHLELARYVAQQTQEAAVVQKTSYIAVPATKRGPLSWSLLLRMVDLAPDDLWCLDQTDARELGAVYYDADRFLRLMRLKNGQLSALASGQWVDQPERLRLHTKCWSKRGRYYADWNKTRKVWRIYTYGDNTYQGQVRGDRAACTSYLDAIVDQLEAEVLQTARTKIEAEPVVEVVEEPAAPEPVVVHEPPKATGARRDLAVWSDEAIIAELIRRTGAEGGTLARYRVKLTPIITHLQRMDGKPTCQGQGGRPRKDLLIVPPAQWAEVTCEECQATELFTTVRWALGGEA